MALRNLLSLLAMATCALVISSNLEQATALSVESHSQHVARHALHGSIAKKRRGNSKRCRKRPTSTSASTVGASTAGATTTKKATSSTPKPSSDSNQGSSNDDAPSKGGSSGGSSGGESGLLRGLAWAVDDRWAPAIADKPKVKWYHHWADGPLDVDNSLEFVPVHWGTKTNDKWNQRVAEMKKKQPQHLMGFNEPDIDSQANMSPSDAAGVWMDQIHPWGKKGVKLVSPQVAFDLDWLDSFLKNIRSQGGWVDAIAIHWYGDFKDIAGFKAYVQKAHDKFGLPIWIPEVGITTASGPSEGDCLNFMQQALGWLESQSYVDRVAWFGAFAQNNPPDGFATGKNALFYAQDSLTSLGKYYGSSG